MKNVLRYLCKINIKLIQLNVIKYIKNDQNRLNQIRSSRDEMNNAADRGRIETFRTSRR